jgi:hypothetical protein
MSNEHELTLKDLIGFVGDRARVGMTSLFSMPSVTVHDEDFIKIFPHLEYLTRKDSLFLGLKPEHMRERECRGKGLGFDVLRGEAAGPGSMRFDYKDQTQHHCPGDPMPWRDKQPEPEGAGFKVGDRVKIARRCDPGGASGWNPTMDDTLGRVGTINEVEHDGSFYVDGFEPAPEPTTVKSCLSPEQLRAELQEADKDPGTTIDWDKMNAILDEAEEGATFSYRSVARAAHKLAEDYATRTLLNDSKINWSIDYGNGKSLGFMVLITSGLWTTAWKTRPRPRSNTNTGSTPGSSGRMVGSLMGRCHRGRGGRR